MRAPAPKIAFAVIGFTVFSIFLELGGSGIQMFGVFVMIGACAVSLLLIFRWFTRSAGFSVGGIMQNFMGGYHQGAAPHPTYAPHHYTPPAGQPYPYAPSSQGHAPPPGQPPYANGYAPEPPAGGYNWAPPHDHHRAQG